MPKNKAALYIRVSTTMQADKDSVPLQEADLRKLADFLKIKQVEVFKDIGFSGKNVDRPAFQEMMTRTKTGEFSHILVWKIDRISRNLLDFTSMYTELKKLGVTFISCNEQFDTSSAMGEAMLKIILVFAELERKMTSERVASVMLGRAQNEAKWNGGRAPFGYKTNNKQWPVIDPNEAPLVLKIFEAYKATRSTLQTANIMNETGTRTRLGAEWDIVQVNRIIKNPFYKGEYVYNRRKVTGNKYNDREIRPEAEWITVKGQHQAIVPEELWNECNEILKNNRSFQIKTGKKTKAQDQYIFGGMLKCSHCGFTLSSIKTVRKNTPAYLLGASYQCNRRYHKTRGCDSIGSTKDAKLVPGLLRLVSRIISACSKPEAFDEANDISRYLLGSGDVFGAVDIEEKTEVLRRIRMRLKNSSASPTERAKAISNSSIIAGIEADKAKMQRALKRLKDLYLFDDNDMTEAEYMERRNEILAKLDKYNEQIKALSINEKVDTNDFGIEQASQLILLKKLQDSNSDFDCTSLLKLVGHKLLREFIQSIIRKIEIDNGKPSKITFVNGFCLTLKY